MKKIRTIITQDAEVDDQNSLRHILLYANDIEIQGIVQTSSVFHWIGQSGAQGPEDKPNYDQVYRWTGTTWMKEVVDDYEEVYENLTCHDKNYPTPHYLRSIIKVGNIGYPGEMDKSTEGSRLIKERILDDDPRTLYIQVWGGTNTIARALFDIEQEYKDSSCWQDLKSKIENKVVITACGEQDNTYRDYIAEVYPNMQFVKCLQMKSYGYAWSMMPEGNSKENLKAEFFKKNILHHGALLDKYATWADGQYYEGEPERCQFGVNKELMKNWWGIKAGMGEHVPYDFLSEGDSPTYFCLFPWGLRGLENFSYGSLSGRFEKDDSQKNSKGELLNYWNPVDDAYVDIYGETVYTESMWGYVEHIQNDFAARANWCVSNVNDEQAPVVEIKESKDIFVTKGQEIQLHLKRQENVDYSIKYYQDASSYKKCIDTHINNNVISINLPNDLENKDQLHFIIEGKNKDKHRLARFAQIIFTVND